jgi:glucose/arabinose dehydrogenase
VISLLRDVDGDGDAIDPTGELGERIVLVSQSGLNHGYQSTTTSILLPIHPSIHRLIHYPVYSITVSGGWLYASTSGTVYRWAYNPTPGWSPGSLETPYLVVTNIPSNGHSSRTLVADQTNTYLYVALGSAGNVDGDDTHAMIRRFPIAAIQGSGGLDWSSGTIVGRGSRNEVGLTFDGDGVLWGAGSQADDLNRDDIGGIDAHQDNPAEELNRYSEEDLGASYGYPYCFSEYKLPVNSMGPGSQW